jgi:hypothetical protein
LAIEEKVNIEIQYIITQNEVNCKVSKIKIRIGIEIGKLTVESESEGSAGIGSETQIFSKKNLFSLKNRKNIKKYLITK